MYKNKKIIAIIPARSESKGLPDKNIKELDGKPLMAYTIQAAIESKIFDYIIVSTDSPKYAEIAKQFGASVPFLRSKELSDDTASSWGACEEVLNKLDEEFDIVVLLQPTSPLRTAQNIVESMDLFMEKDADIVVGVAKTPHPIQWCNILPENHSLYNFVKEKDRNKRRQELEQSYTINGAVYIIKPHLIDANFDMFCEKSYAYIMDENKSIDVDSKKDFIIAQALLRDI